MCEYIVISALRVWKHAVCAVLDAAFCVAEISPTSVSQSVQRAVAKKAVEIFDVRCFVAREILAPEVLEERVVRTLLLFSLSSSYLFSSLIDICLYDNMPKFFRRGRLKKDKKNKEKQKKKEKNEKGKAGL